MKKQWQLFSIVAAMVWVAAVGYGEEQKQNLLAPHNRFMDGSVDASKAKITPSVSMIDSFEDIDAIKRCWVFDKIGFEQSSEHATDGTHSLKLTFKDKNSAVTYKNGSMAAGRRADDWGMRLIFNDEARMDVFNAEDHVVKLVVKMGVEFKFDLKPGANTISMKTREMVDAEDVYRIAYILQMTRLSVEEGQPATLFVDNFRWVGPGLGENLIRYGKCFQGGAVVEEYQRPYFLPLIATTGYDKQRGYGWERPSAAENNLGMMRSHPSTYRQSLGSLIRSTLEAVQSPLLIDLPDGKYHMVWCEGHSFIRTFTNVTCDHDLSIRVNGKVTPIRKRAKDFEERLRYFNSRDRVDYLPGEDRWTKYMSPWHYPLECDVEVTGGQLKLEFLTDPPDRANISFLLIYPVEHSAAIEPEVAALWNDIRYRFNEMSNQHVSLKLAQQMNLPGLHEELENPVAAAKRAASLAALPTAANGLLVFDRPGGEDVYPDTVPAVETLTSEIATLGPPGEIASLAINLHALKDIQNIQVDIDEFTSPDGKRIPKNNCDLRFVRYSYRMSGQQTHGDWKYMMMPWFLVKRDQIEMKKAMSARYWLNIDVPADAAPGKYTAKCCITGKDIQPLEVKLALDVLPIRLDPVPQDVEFSTLWTIYNTDTSMDADNLGLTLRTRMDAERANAWRDTLFARTIERCKAEFDLMRHYGLTRIYCLPITTYNTIGPDKLPDEVKTILPLINMVSQEKKGWQVREDPLNSDHKKYAWICKLADLTRDNVDKIKARGEKPVLFGEKNEFNVTTVQEEYGIYRMSAGVLLWRLGFSGCMFRPWKYEWSDPYHPFDGHTGDFGSLALPASHDWPFLNTTMILEGAREGILDYRYLATLERLVKANAGKPAAEAAEKYLKSLQESVKPEASFYFVQVSPVSGWSGWDNTWHQKETCWKGKDYTAMRRNIAALIQQLQQAK
ncbi:MAG: hypothetical protein FWD61_03725 [Phycisphaerales bacterium]|nr:hypothetical protein [Phycisphaerales bacterium]